MSALAENPALLRLRPAFRTAGALLFVGAVVLVYRWADPERRGDFKSRSQGSTFLMRLSNTTFSGYSGGVKVWSIWAHQIDIDRQPGSSLANIRSANLTDIRSGLLYPSGPDGQSAGSSHAVAQHSAVPSAVSPLIPAGETSSDASGARPASTDVHRIPVDSDNSLGPPVAQFSAQHGRFSSANVDVLPPELVATYLLRWQFRLSGDVTFQTSGGEKLNAETLTVLDMTSRRDGRPERFVLCDDGARVSINGSSIIANQARYDFRSRTVECLGGARGTFKDGSFQGERIFWSLADQSLRIPDRSSGSILDTPFTADSAILDLKSGTMRATHIELELSSSGVSKVINKVTNSAADKEATKVIDKVMDRDIHKEIGRHP